MKSRWFLFVVLLAAAAMAAADQPDDPGVEPLRDPVPPIRNSDVEDGSAHESEKGQSESPPLKEKKSQKPLKDGTLHNKLSSPVRSRGGSFLSLRSPMFQDWDAKYLKLKKQASTFIERKDVRSFKSVLLMIDVLFVLVSIQSQLDHLREKNVDYAIMSQTAGDPSFVNKVISRLPGTKQPSKITHLEKSMLFHTEMLFSFKASMTILATLLGEKLVHLWSQGERWLSKKTEMVDVTVLSLSIIFEYIFHKMEHSGGLKDRKGSLLRWVVENWRFVRIIHGSYETLEHSPLIAPLLHGKGGHKGH